MTRAQLEARVDELARAHEGDDFVAAVRELADGLDQEERDVLGAVLVTRSRALEDAVDERAAAKGWLRRTLDPAERRRARR